MQMSMCCNLMNESINLGIIQKLGVSIFYFFYFFYFYKHGCIKGSFHPKMKIMSLMTHPHVVLSP